MRPVGLRASSMSHRLQTRGLVDSKADCTSDPISKKNAEPLRPKKKKEG
ncbi:hypothetical protein Sinac_7340 [Singulisphaera acidiphila DSM 18658]|uniref:Uncharacterized protein n=1 Tax=Singulisphaera acidiphila (strain ATCC BAA-1392 / DSM 18658 / VKM B-2454 / MOB10) TaxID=886293 RepID=L0DPU6_SINAD|nr:hypothetical protein Sinac_7340 [Singulisphaera acidiphila DSM 18658]